MDVFKLVYTSTVIGAGTFMDVVNTCNLATNVDNLESIVINDYNLAQVQS